MIDIHKMVFINVILSLLLALGIFLFKKIFPKKKINYFILLLCISFLPIASTLRFGDYESGDFNLHLYRAIPFFHALADGIVFPSWASNLNAGYGYPVFLFNYTFPYYIIALFHVIGFSFIASMKAFLISSYMFSGSFFYLWAKRIFKKPFFAFYGAVFYLFAPYHLVDQHFRVSTGEIAAFAVLPLFLFFLDKTIQKKSIFFNLVTGAITGIFFLAHSAIALFSIIFIGIPYSLFLYFSAKEKGGILQHIVFAFGSGIIFSSPSWVPYMFLTKFTHVELINSWISFPQVTELLYSPWRYGLLFQGPKGELSFLIGYTQLIVVITLIALYTREKIPRLIKKQMLFWLILFFVILFFITPFSSPLWQILPLLRVAQFTTRLLLPLALCTAVLAAYLAASIKNKRVLIALLVITIAYTILNWGQRRVIPQITDTELIRNIPKATMQGEAYPQALPKWWDVSRKDFWNVPLGTKHMEVIGGSVQVKEMFRNTIVHKYVFSEKQTITAKDNTAYFPGWNVTVDGKNVPIDYANPKDPDRIIFSVPPGDHKVTVEYKDVWYLALAKSVAILGYAIVLIFTATRTLGSYINI